MQRADRGLGPASAAAAASGDWRACDASRRSPPGRSGRPATWWADQPQLQGHAPATADATSRGSRAPTPRCCRSTVTPSTTTASRPPRPASPPRRRPVVDGPAGSALVLDWVDGQTWTDAVLDDAPTCRGRRGVPRAARRAAVRQRLRHVRGPAALPAGRARARVPAARRYVEFLPQCDADPYGARSPAAATVPCHNDLLAANMIDDGERLWLIDYEYAGNNDPCFELGNIWSESALANDQLEALVSAYYGGLGLQDRSSSPARPDVEVRLDAVGVHPGRRQPASTSTSGPGGWRSTSGPSPNSTAGTCPASDEVIRDD